MFVLPTSMASSILCSLRTCAFAPSYFPGEHRFYFVADTIQQCTVIVDAFSTATHHSRRSVPLDVQPRQRRRQRAPGGQNSIELAGLKVCVPSRKRAKNL